MPSSSIGSLLFSFGSTERTAQEGGRIGGHFTPSLSLSFVLHKRLCVCIYTIYIYILPRADFGCYSIDGTRLHSPVFFVLSIPRVCCAVSSFCADVGGHVTRMFTQTNWIRHYRVCIYTYNRVYRYLDSFFCVWRG
jgi:hypothetical protein